MLGFIVLVMSFMTPNILLILLFCLITFSLVGMRCGKLSDLEDSGINSWLIFMLITFENSPKSKYPFLFLSKAFATSNASVYEASTLSDYSCCSKSLYETNPFKINGTTYHLHLYRNFYKHWKCWQELKKSFSQHLPLCSSFETEWPLIWNDWPHQEYRCCYSILNLNQTKRLKYQVPGYSWFV